MRHRVTPPDASTIIWRQVLNQVLPLGFFSRRGMHPKLAKLLFWPTYGWNLLLGRVLRCRHWWDPIEPNVLLGARPWGRDVKPLFDLGVRAVVNMCEEYAGPTEFYRQLGIEQLWLPTVDFQPPSLDDVCQGVEFIQQQVGLGRKVYVHCKAGRARSATVVLCWLIKYRRQTAETAQALLEQRRPHVSRSLWQRAVVKEFASKELTRSPGTNHAE